MERGPSKEGALGRPMDERGYLASQPPELRIEGALDEIRRRVVESGRRVVVLDDDPTGVQSVHWVRQDGELVPAGQTEFAADHSFGYRSSDLKAWVGEKTGGRIKAHEVVSVGLADLREGGPERVLKLLEEASGGIPVVINAASYADLEVFVLGMLTAEEEGKRFLSRTGPSFVRTRGGIT